MSRYSHPIAEPGQATIEGDGEFKTVNMKEDRETLPPGVLALSINKRLRSKRAATRHGIYPPIYFNAIAFGAILGAGIFANPNSEAGEVLLLATSNAVYALRDGSYPCEVPLPPGLTLEGEIDFVPANTRVYLFRGEGEGKTQLVWDGMATTGFELVTKKNPADTSTRLIPPAVTAEPISDRFLIPQGNDILVTDIDDYTSYDHVLEVHHVGRELGDPIVRVFKYANGIAPVFCKRSSYLFQGFTGEPTLATVQSLHSRIGLAGRRAIVMEGSDVLFLSAPGGIFRMMQSFENRQEIPAVPVSDPIQPLIDRINWSAAGGAVAEQLGENVYFAVPIDGSTRNNALIVYNAATQLIEGYDTWPAGFHADDLKVTLAGGSRRMVAIDKVAGRIYLLDEGNSDFVYDGDTLVEYPIEDLMETRAYSTLGWNATSSRSFKRTEIHARTWSPSVTVTELTQGAGDERLLTPEPITRNRLAYDQFAKADWDPTNVNDDWDSPARQDYSVAADDTGILLDGAGVDPDRKQYQCFPFALRTQAAYVSYRIANSQGLCDVLAVGPVESMGTNRQLRRGA